jgi:hypothetical protein
MKFKNVILLNVNNRCGFGGLGEPSEPGPSPGTEDDLQESEEWEVFRGEEGNDLVPFETLL